MNDIVKHYAKSSTLLAIKVKGETVLGTLVKDDDSCSGYAFKSAICPTFIKEENLIYNETEETAMREFFENITRFMFIGGEVYISFDIKGDEYHRVVEVRPFDMPVFNSPCLFA